MLDLASRKFKTGSIPGTEKELNQFIKKMHPDAFVTVQALPQCPDISLYLVEPQTMRRHFSQDEILQIQQYPAYWAFCWASGQVLAREILQRPEWVKNKKVMDFGAGSGVVAIAAAMAGAREVIVCDIDPEALASCTVNADINKINSNTSVTFRYHDDLLDFNEPLDLLIAADVLYDQENLPLLDIFLEKSPEVLLADSRIRNFNVPPYQRIGSENSFTVPDLDELDEFRQVNLYHAQR